MDDEFIFSGCFNFVECFDSTPFAAIIFLVKNLESFLCKTGEGSQTPTNVDKQSTIWNVASGDPGMRRVVSVRESFRPMSTGRGKTVGRRG